MHALFYHKRSRRQSKFDLEFNRGLKDYIKIS